MAFKFDFRKVLIVFIIAVLTAVLAYSVTTAIMPRPNYEDFCAGQYERPQPMRSLYGPNFTCPQIDDSVAKACVQEKGVVEYQYDQFGCPTSMSCNYCQRDLQAAQKRFNFITFIVDSIIAVIAILIGLNLPGGKEVNNWVGTGLLFGGLISLFFGTVVYYSELGRYIRPAVIFIELALVIYLSYKRFSKN